MHSEHHCSNQQQIYRTKNYIQQTWSCSQLGRANKANKVRTLNNNNLTDTIRDVPIIRSHFAGYPAIIDIWFHLQAAG